MTAEQARPAVELSPADELDLLDRMPPEKEDPASVWLEWHERHVTCWERIAAEAPYLADNAAYMIDGHWRDIKELLADPASRRARRGYWDLWPKITDL
jgi:hypothetical protein